MSTGETAVEKTASGGDKTGPPPEALKGPALKEKIAAILKDADLEQVKKGWTVVPALSFQKFSLNSRAAKLKIFTKLRLRKLKTLSQEFRIMDM